MWKYAINGKFGKNMLFTGYFTKICENMLLMGNLAIIIYLLDIWQKFAIVKKLWKYLLMENLAKKSCL